MFEYSREHDVCIFAFAEQYDTETGVETWRIVMTDRDGNILAASEQLTAYDGTHTCSLYLLDNILLADMTRMFWDGEDPEDKVISEIFTVPFTVDAAGNIIFQ